jgi:peptide/nickel transport system substrate-binding protein
VVDARSVMFFLNMYRADPTAYCGYNPKFAIPDQVRSVSGRADSVTITFSAPVNPTWLLDNYLSQITPMPDVWDRTSPTHRAGCATGAFGTVATKNACTAVVAYLAAQGSLTSTFAKPFWQSGVDGPWRLSAFDAAGNATFMANTRYSGPQRAQVHKFQEVAYTSALAEQADLKAGRLSVGYLDPAVLSSPAPGPGRAGPNWGPLASTYTMQVGTPWAFNYAALNFSSADPQSQAINQLYVRQALQLSVDQTTLIQDAFNGYASAIDSPLPPGTPASLARPVANPYPYDPAAAAALLASHGWTLSGAVLTCASPGTGASQCGAGISAGYALTFNVVVAGNSPALSSMVNAEATIWRSLGIGVTVMTASFDTVVGDCQGGSGFEICEWGTGWSYEPGYYPSGDALFSPGGPFNVGSYNDAKMTTLIGASIRGPGTLTSYAQYAARQLPVLYQPQANVVVEILKSLKSTVGFTPNPLGDLMPEYYHF